MLGWDGLGWIGMDWVGLGWVGLGWVGLGCVGLSWVELDWIWLSWVGLGCVIKMMTDDVLFLQLKLKIPTTCILQYVFEFIFRTRNKNQILKKPLI